jgi:hypothetical protein
MAHLFLSHSNADDGFVRELRDALADLGQAVWIDSRQLRGGDPLESEIQAAIEAAAGLAVLVSPAALQSEWVGKELVHGLKVQAERGRDDFPVIPLSLNGTRLGVLQALFKEEPIYISVSSAPGGATAALDAILVALGLRLPTDRPPLPQPRPEPVAELVLELSDLGFDEQDGVRRPAARARLVYEPASAGQEKVVSEQMWRLIGPARADRGGGAGLVSGALAGVAQPAGGRSRQAGGGEPDRLGPGPPRRRPAAATHRQRAAGLGGGGGGGKPSLLRFCRRFPAARLQ